MQRRKISGTRAEAGPNRKPVNLALQGGGAHGAFTWGVLDKLAEDGRLSIDAISATSAGAMNAVVFGYGFALDGLEGARRQMHQFWHDVSRAGSLLGATGSFPWSQWLQAAGLGLEHSPGYLAFQAVTHMFSPYQLNPLNFNPLADVLAKSVDFERLSASAAAPRLFLSATNVRTGKIKVFDNAKITRDVVLASACLPYIFQAVEIDGEHYWDGGFMGNPAIFPLIYDGGSRDVVIVHINPIVRHKLPTTSSEIFNRINEISFNSSLMREMRAVAFISRLVDAKALDPAKYSRMLIHSIRDDAAMCALGVATKLDPNWEFLCQLRDAGRARAAHWLEQSLDSIGLASTIDVDEVFL